MARDYIKECSVAICDGGIDCKERTNPPENLCKKCMCYKCARGKCQRIIASTKEEDDGRI